MFQYNSFPVYFSLISVVTETNHGNDIYFKDKIVNLYCFVFLMNKYIKSYTYTLLCTLNPLKQND